MRVTDKKYFEAYWETIGKNIETLFNTIDFSDEQVDTGYRVKASAVFSSNIEGNSVDLNSFMNSMLSEQAFKPRKEIQEIKDLIAAYEFAQANLLTEANFLHAHALLSEGLLIRDKRGVYRNDRMGVFDNSGLVYLAIEPQYVEEKMGELFSDISTLLSQEHSIAERFYHAALIHLKFVHIHPLWDGNGRSARLLEKWFLSHSLNSRAWKIQSEKYYKEQLDEYYQNINLGVNYYELDYDKCLPFLLMLAKSLEEDN